MDVDDLFAIEPATWRNRVCACVSMPIRPGQFHGCLCPLCGAQCKECTGFGFAKAPPRRFHQILSRVRSQINRRMRVRGAPPGYVRLNENEIGTILRKFSEEDQAHWINEYVDPGPPLRIFDVIIIRDRRKP